MDALQRAQYQRARERELAGQVYFIMRSFFLLVFICVEVKICCITISTRITACNGCTHLRALLSPARSYNFVLLSDEALLFTLDSSIRARARQAEPRVTIPEVCEVFQYYNLA